MELKPFNEAAVHESVSIVVPAYNEAARLSASLVEILVFARTCPQIAEIIVVDDGSSDETANVFSRMKAGLAIDGAPLMSLIRHIHNCGKGAAVRTGFQAARGEVVLFSDADLSTPITEAPRLFEPILRCEYDVVIGSRAMRGSRIEQQQTLLRRGAGRLFNRMVRWATHLNVADTQCGFKAFRRTSFAPLFAAQRIDGFAFDVELLYLASRAGLRVLELPVRWAHADGGKVSMTRHTWQMARDVLSIRVNDFRGLYPPPACSASTDLNSPRSPEVQPSAKSNV